MYQWTDSETGTTQLSGKPPAWYRGIEKEPRVFVFSGGKIIDDTAIKISDDERESLRIQAFIGAEENRLAAKQKAIEAAKIKGSYGRQTSDVLRQSHKMQKYENKKLMEAEINEDKASDEKMKAVVAEWERKKTADAKATIKE